MRLDIFRKNKNKELIKEFQDLKLKIFQNQVPTLSIQHAGWCIVNKETNAAAAIESQQVLLFFLSEERANIYLDQFKNKNDFEVIFSGIIYNRKKDK